MNQSDRTALEAIARQLDALAQSVETLTDPKTASALRDLVEIAPALKELAEKAPALEDLADGYRMAGKAGGLVKWIASVAAALGALWAILQLHFFGVSPK